MAGGRLILGAVGSLSISKLSRAKKLGPYLLLQTSAPQETIYGLLFADENEREQCCLLLNKNIDGDVSAALSSPQINNLKHPPVEVDAPRPSKSVLLESVLGLSRPPCSPAPRSEEGHAAESASTSVMRDLLLTPSYMRLHCRRRASFKIV